MSTLKYWVWLSSIIGIRPIIKSRILEAFGNPEALFFAEESEYARIEGITEGERALLNSTDISAAVEILDECLKTGVDILTVQDVKYPARLRNIFDPPAVLYIKGRLPAVDEEAAIGIVGTRKATPYGIKMARRLGYEVTRCGGLVVSGLAEGIDSAAAYGALRAGGSCIGVLGTAIDIVYPSFNKSLFDDVAATGALISEYPPGSPKTKGTFPARNRIIAGLSKGVAIIEAPSRSGALITADRALEYGRDLFALPGNADAQSSAGSNALIRECAKAVMSGWDIMSEYERLFPERVKRVDGARAKIPQEGDAEGPCKRPEKSGQPQDYAGESGRDFVRLRIPSTKKVIDKKNDREYIDLEKQLEDLTESQLKIVSVMSERSMHVDDIIDISRLPAAEVLSGLTVLEIKGCVSQEKGKRFTLNIASKK